MEEKLNGRAKREGKGALWKKHPKRGATIGVGVDDRRDSSVILDLQVRREGVSCRRQLGTRSDLLLEVEGIKLVWMQGKEKRERRAHREEKRSKGRESGAVTPLENFLRKCSMGYTLYPWISLLEPTLETSYKPQT